MINDLLHKPHNVCVVVNMLGYINKSMEDNLFVTLDKEVGVAHPGQPYLAITHQSHTIKLPLLFGGGYVCPQPSALLLGIDNLIRFKWLHPCTFTLHHDDQAVQVFFPHCVDADVVEMKEI